MKTIFINNIRIDFIDITESIQTSTYDTVLQQEVADYVPFFKGNLLIVNPQQELMNQLVDTFLASGKEGFKRLTFLVKEPKIAFERVTKDLVLVEAAGGIVKKEKEILLIKRFGLWDIPKGHIEKGENKKVAAVREVEEECGVKAKIKTHIVTTYHTYPLRKTGKYALKKTYWYEMKCLDDKTLVPQTEEGIEEVKWMTKRKAFFAMENSYHSLLYLLNKYYYR
ncbi:MAG: NUDIX domain-containing protein [Cytophagales bacterium]|nr:NUDIX domain-containing protein [Cytophagales bacterium]